MTNSSIWPRDRTISGVTTTSHSRPGKDGNKWVLRIPLISYITGTWLSDCLVSYAGHLLAGGEFYSSAEMQSVYSTRSPWLGNITELKQRISFSLHCGSPPWHNGWRRCPWCNGYRRRNWTRRHEFKSWTRLITFHIALIPLGKVWIQLFSLQLWVNSRAD